MLVPLTAIVTTSLPMAAAIALCAKDRKTTHAKNKNKSNKSTRSKSAHGKSSKSGKSSRSHRSKSQRSKRSSKSGKKGKSSKSKKSGKSGKAGKSGKSSKSKKQVKGTATSSASAASAASGASEKSEKSAKSSKSSRKSSKSSKSRKARLDSDAQKKMEKSGKSTKVVSAACAAKPQATGGKQMEKSLVEEVNSIKHSNQMSVAPAKLQYQTLGGLSQIELKNTSGERKAYKVKCSDNALYRVNPVYGFAEPHSTTKIDVLRLNGEQKTDKLVLLTANAKDSSDPHEAFAKQQEHREMMVVPLVAA